MLSKNEIKILKSLRQNKFRQKYKKFVVENPKTASEFLRHGTYEIDTLLVTESYADSHADLLAPYRGKYRVIPPRDMEQISLLTTASNIYLTAEIPADVSLPASSSGWYIYLDQVQDPGNVGTIIRIADWYGMSGVIRSPESADWYNPKTVQATMGSMVNVALHTGVYASLPDLPTYGATLDGHAVDAIEWPQDGILIIGNESRGISPAIAAQLDHAVHIPGAASKVAESLNAAMATGILVDRLTSQR